MTEMTKSPLSGVGGVGAHYDYAGYHPPPEMVPMGVNKLS